MRSATGPISNVGAARSALSRADDAALAEALSRWDNNTACVPVSTNLVPKLLELHQRTAPDDAIAAFGATERRRRSRNLLMSPDYPDVDHLLRDWNPWSVGWRHRALPAPG